MIKTVKIKGYKTIETLKFELGRVTVLIGENGVGKTNILEAIAKGEELALAELAEFSEVTCVNSTELSQTQSSFQIFSPEIKALRYQTSETLPLGEKGEGLGRLIRDLTPEQLSQLKLKSKRMDWFNDLSLDPTLTFTDQYSDITLTPYTCPESFLFFLFYLCLFLSPKTPKSFAIENIGQSLNPRLCHRLIYELVNLAKENDKQVIFTTHSPTILDGLDLTEDDQRLYVVTRNSKSRGQTKIHRIHPSPFKNPLKLSESWLRGYI